MFYNKEYFHVHILAEVPLSERDMLLTLDGLDLDYIRNIRLIHFHGSPGIVQDLRQLPVMPSGYTAAVLLANWDRHDKRCLSNFESAAVMLMPQIRP
eukprot:scaffold93328_cov38-Prasinocladus_malaysianus.AAC.1